MMLGVICYVRLTTSIMRCRYFFVERTAWYFTWLTQDGLRYTLDTCMHELAVWLGSGPRPGVEVFEVVATYVFSFYRSGIDVGIRSSRVVS